MPQPLRYLAVPIAPFAALSLPALAPETRHESFPFQPGQRLEVKIERGDIEYRTGAGGGNLLTLRNEDGDIRIESAASR